MSERPRWDLCIANYGEEALAFAASHFGEEQRHCLFIGGAGFDPRCVTFAAALAKRRGNRMEAVLLREQRPKPPAVLIARADKNIEALREVIATVKVIDIEVMAGDDGAIVGGRRATEAIGLDPIGPFTDIVLDLSALSVGISFPVARLLLHQVGQSTPRKNSTPGRRLHRRGRRRDQERLPATTLIRCMDSAAGSTLKRALQIPKYGCRRLLWARRRRCSLNSARNCATRS